MTVDGRLHPAYATVQLREGITVTVGHSVLSVPGVGGIRLEHTFQITKEGAVPLTRFPADIVLCEQPNDAFEVPRK